MPVLRQLWTRPSERERFYLFPDLIPLPQFTTETFAGGATVELQAYLNHLAHLSDDPVDIVPCFEQADQMQCWQAKTQVLMTEMAHDAWVLSGSLCGWGDGAIPLFELVVFLWISRDIRVARLRQREHKRFGERILPGGDMYESSQAFLARAASYDAGGGRHAR